MTKIFIAGIKGFIGSHLKEYVRENTDWKIVSSINGDQPDYIVHLAGHSQIDKSIENPDYVSADISTTMDLLTSAETVPGLKKFLYFSSDEVFGPKECVLDFYADDPYNPYSPYAAGKAACEGLCMAWTSTYGVPTVITHCQNLFGERQPANKFVPTVVRCALTGEPVTIYSDGAGIDTQRDFLHVRDACAAIVLLLKRGKVREKYNISPLIREAHSPEYIVGFVSIILEKDIEIVYKPSKNVRPGFFLKHGLNGGKLKDLGWKRRSMDESLMETVKWLALPGNRKWIGL